MQNNELLIPFYCFSCGNLTFVHRQGSSEHLSLIDYKSPNWRLHTCFNVSKPRFLANRHIQKMNSLDWGSDRLPFAHRIQAEDRKQRKFTLGVVIGLPQKTSKDRFFQVLTLENSLIELKSVQKELPESCGMVVDLSDMIRIGKGKYRLESIKYCAVSNYQPLPGSETDEVYQIILSADDQEQLETFITRMLRAFLSRKISPLSIIPLKITRKNQKKMHQRQITIPSESDIFSVIEKSNVPEFIHLSVKQITISKEKSENLIDARQ